MKLIVGNWKMYPAKISEAKKIIGDLKKDKKKFSRARVVICPPAPFLSSVGGLLKNSGLLLGAQNSFIVDDGAYTGEVSPLALTSVGVSHVILGHSERRALGEDDALVARKSLAAVRNKLKVILCVGESARDDAGAYFSEVGRELRASLEGFPKNETSRLVVAYEPIWAIGTKATRAARPEDFREMSVFIRRNLVERFGKKLGFAVPILYGGSVDDRNARNFFTEGGADGLLVGRASLDPEKFSAIIQSVK